MRKEEKLLWDDNVLSVDFHQVLIDPALIENSTPMLGLYAAVQQINCIRNLDGEIVQVSQPIHSPYAH